MKTKNNSKLPRIMYDQTQYTPLYFIDEKSVYISEASYQGMGQLSGYAPEKWYTYTQNKPESFWFGAYDENAIEEEAKIGFLNFTDEKFCKKFESEIEESHRKAKDISREFLTKFHNKESHALDKDPNVVADFLERMRIVMVFIESRYLLTQPQRFYKFDEEIKKFLPDPKIERISSSGRHLTFVSKLNKHVLDTVKNIKVANENYDVYMSRNPQWKEKTLLILGDTGFLNWTLFGGELADEAYFEKEVDSLLKDSKKYEDESQKMNELIRNIQERNYLLKNNTGLGFKLADMMGHSAVIRFDLNTIALSLLNYVDLLVKALQQKYSLGAEEIHSYYFDEILDLVNRGIKVESKIIGERQKGFLKIYTLSGSKTLLAEEAHKEIKNLLEFRINEIKTTKEVKGTVASFPNKERPKVTGRAFVLTTAFDMGEELKKFKDGDILVATQTHPHLVPMMKGSTGIVTDEGGITCHAAIVSRELNKPCIIGTKLATKFLKTGDKIEMDMKTGTVRKI